MMISKQSGLNLMLGQKGQRLSVLENVWACVVRLSFLSYRCRLRRTAAPICISGECTVLVVLCMLAVQLLCRH